MDEWNTLPLVDGESPWPDAQRSAGQTYAEDGDGCGDTHDSGDKMEEDEDAVSDRYDAAESVMFKNSSLLRRLCILPARKPQLCGVRTSRQSCKSLSRPRKPCKSVAHPKKRGRHGSI